MESLGPGRLSNAATQVLSNPELHQRIISMELIHTGPAAGLSVTACLAITACLALAAAATVVAFAAACIKAFITASRSHNVPIGILHSRF